MTADSANRIMAEERMTDAGAAAAMYATECAKLRVSLAEQTKEVERLTAEDAKWKADALAECQRLTAENARLRAAIDAARGPRTGGEDA